MNEYTVHLHVDGQFEGQVNEDLLRQAAHHALRTGQAPSPSALTLAIVPSKTVRALNAQHRGKDAPTDVLSYPPGQEPYATEPGEPPYLGDVLVAFPIAEAQALEAGHNTQEELHLLAVHGVLHLLGYDHHTPDEQSAMQAAQNAALQALRASIP